jgi:hypothetical protein
MFDDGRSRQIGLRRRGPQGVGSRRRIRSFHSISQLAYLETEALTKEYEERIYEDLLGPASPARRGPRPPRGQLPRSRRPHGASGQRLSPSGDNMPMADVVTSRLCRVTVAEGGIGYSYTLHELEVGREGLPDPLPASKQEAAVEGYLEPHGRRR